MSGEFHWSGAALLYEKALSSDPKPGTVESARITELLARSYFRGAFQAQSREEFKRVMKLGQDAYERAAHGHGELGLEARSKRATALELYAAFWIRDAPLERKSLVDKCVALASEAASAFEAQADEKGLAQSYHDLLVYRREALNLATERKALTQLFEGASDAAWKAVEKFQKLGDEEGLIETYHSLVFLYLEADHVVDPPRFEELLKTLEKLRPQIIRVCERLRKPYPVLLANEMDAFLTGDLDSDMAKALNQCEAAAVEAEEIHDSYFLGRLYAGASSFARWAAGREEYVERRRELFQKAIEYSARAIKNLEVPLAGAWLKLAYSRTAEAYTNLALIVETDQAKKREDLRRAVDAASRGMAYEDHAWKAGGVAHELSKAMYFLATMEDGLDEKTRLLKEAVITRDRTVRSHDALSPLSWSRGVMLNYSALLKSELATVEKEPKGKVLLLQEAVSDIQQCVDQCSKWAMASFQTNALAGYEEWYGDILQRLYQYTREASTAQNALRVYEDAVKHLKTSGNNGPVAAVRWKLARTYDSMGDYKEASNSFTTAAEEYRLSVGRVPPLASVLEELATYMEAWSLIEEARLDHEEEKYNIASENYRKVAGLLQRTKTWAYLSPHYVASSLLENGEGLSQQEKLEASTENFASSAKAFQETRKELEIKIKHSSGSSERQELADWHLVTSHLEKYSLSRKALEEARILDRKGEEKSSSARYSSAASSFKALLEETADEKNRRELETLTLVCEAWAKMKEAEAEVSTELYAEAAQSFVKVEKTAPKRRFRLLALANATMCNALELGTRFRQTRDTQLYSQIKKHLETAADYYQEAGFENAADWTHGTERLFDALVYLTEAEAEKESDKKADLFHLAVRHFQQAARIYADAGFAKKSNEALRYLKKAQEEKQLLLAPIEVLAESPAVTEVTVSPVSLTRERAFGLERFETANVVGKFHIAEREPHVGEDVTCKLEISNAGRSTATLIRLEGIVPKGLTIDSARVPYRVEGDSLDMRGKRLEYLKTLEVEIPLKTAKKGSYQVRPTLIFADEKGNLRTHEFELVSLTVKELGIAGWIRGPGR